LPTKVAVVIPTHKEELNELEKISLAQCRKVLGRYPLIFAIPEGKNFSWIPEGSRVVHFPHLGQGTDHYNILLMSPQFYELFLEYDYILIYHVDAFVFYDALEEFCLLGYDYIGAPWPRIYTEKRKSLSSRVGNGGFCLRNVKAHYELLKAHPNLIAQWHAIKFPEDVFFSHCGKRDDCNFHVAPINIAYKFAAEFNPARVVKKNGGKLPFGCHDWKKKNPEFYIRNFLQFGYDLRLVQKLLNFSDGGLRNWLLKVAIQRLNCRLQRRQSILCYLPTRRFASVRVIRHPDTIKILTQLLLEDNSLADKIFLYDPDEQNLNKLLRDLTLDKQPHLLINLVGYDNEIISAVEQRGFAYGKRVVSFWREYLTRCERLFRKLGK